MMYMKLFSGCVDGGISIEIVKEFVNENSNRYVASILLDTFNTGLISVFVGSDGYDCSIDSFIV